MKHLNSKVGSSDRSYQEDCDRKVEELKQTYTELIEKQKRQFMSSTNDHDVIEQFKDELRKLTHDKIMLEEMIQRLEGQVSRVKDKNKGLKLRCSDLEQSEKRAVMML